jgi:uncharacterized protein (DUF4415 family)
MRFEWDDGFMGGSRRKPKRIPRIDWDAVASPRLTVAQLKKMHPMKTAMPDLVESVRRTRGRPKLDHPKMLVSLRLDADVVDAFKAQGPGWQTRINAVLARWARKRSKAA